MRFERLDILRYGALTDRSLAFRPGAGLHVVYGPNEAGKSSALSAIGDLLFGFPRATPGSPPPYTFLHDAQQLRIGAKLVSRDGATIDFRRRRAKNALLSNDERESLLREDALVPFLGTLNREIFKRAFGLDTEDLRDGGQAMLQSGGEIGNLLFSAASGLLGLTRLRQSLEGEAGGIFGPRKKQDHSFYQATDRHDQARRAEKENELKSTDWKRLVAEAEQLESEIAALQSERRKTKTELERLRALKKLQPLVIDIDGELQELAAFDNLAGLPADFAADLAEALHAHASLAGEVRKAEEDTERLGDEISQVHVEPAALEAAADITTLFAETGAYAKARRDLPAIDREVGSYDATLTQLARRLGLESAAELEKRQPSDADLVRMRRLVEEGQELLRNRADLQRQQGEESDRLATLDAQGDGGRLVDPKPYIDQLAALSADLSDIARGDALLVQAERAEENLRAAALRLRPPVRDLAAILAMPLPDVATLTARRAAIEQATLARNAAVEKVAALAAEVAEIAERLREAERDGPVVTREEIAAARDRRDGRFAALGEGRLPSADELAILGGLVAHADQLADTALTHADRLSRHAENRLRQDRAEHRLAAARQRLAVAEDDVARAQQDFSGLIEASGLAAHGLVFSDPAAAIEWRRAVDGLAKERAAIDPMRDQLAAIELKQGRIRPVLNAIADALGIDVAHLPLGALSQAIGRHLDGLSERWSQSRTREGERNAARQRLGRLTVQVADVAGKIQAWQTAFAAAAPTIGLAAESADMAGHAVIDMAVAALDAWKSLPETLLERENRRRRVAGMRRDIRDYEEKVAAVAVSVDPSLEHVGADLAIETLHELAIAARNASQKRKILGRALADAELRRERAREAFSEGEARLAALAHRLPEQADPETALGRLKDRARLAERLRECRSRFLAQAEGRSEADVRAALDSFDRIQAELDIETLTEAENGQFERHGELVARQAQNRKEREALETGVSAEYAVFEKLSAETEAKDLARQWVVLKLAAGLLAHSMDRYRERHADPVMQRAGAHFSVLTGGRFSRLVQDYDEKDELHLLAERAGGEKVPLDGLSEGTGDQLFLALRLAFLEDYASRNEPAPLIVDDIFQTFDDERTVSGLKALAATSGTFQTILFTHQKSVVDLARQELAAGVDVIML